MFLSNVVLVNDPGGGTKAPPAVWGGRIFGGLRSALVSLQVRARAATARRAMLAQWVNRDHPVPRGSARRRVIYRI